MFYFDYQNLSIVEIAPEDVIRKFSETTTSPRGVEPKYFYEEGSIWSWKPNGGRNYLGSYEQDVAQAKLLQWAKNDAVLNHNIYIYLTKTEVLEEIKQFIDDAGAWDLDDPRDVETRNQLIAVVEKESSFSG